jgi:hypothetical protein
VFARLHTVPQAAVPGVARRTLGYHLERGSLPTHSWDGPRRIVDVVEIEQLLGPDRRLPRGKGGPPSRPRIHGRGEQRAPLDHEAILRRLVGDLLGEVADQLESRAAHQFEGGARACATDG